MNKLKNVLKNWLRKFCGGNSHFVLGHCRSFPPGDIEAIFDPTCVSKQTLQIPIVLAGNRFLLIGKYNQIRPLLHRIPNYPYRNTCLSQLKARLLFPVLPLLTFGALWEELAPLPGFTVPSKPSLVARAKSLIAKCWDWVTFGPELSTRRTPSLADSPWLHAFGPKILPANLGQTTRTVKRGPSICEGGYGGLNTDYRTATYGVKPPNFDLVNLGPAPKKKSACKRTVRRSTKSGRRSKGSSYRTSGVGV